MNPDLIPLGVCRCGTVKHAVDPMAQEQTRELIRAARLAGKPDLADFYAERLTHCHTAFNREQVAS